MELSLRISAISLQHFKCWWVHLEKLQNICTWNWNIKIKLNELMGCVEFSLTGRKPAKTVSRWVNFVGFSVPEYNDTLSVQFLCCSACIFIYNYNLSHCISNYKFHFHTPQSCSRRAISPFTLLFAFHFWHYDYPPHFDSV